MDYIIIFIIFIIVVVFIILTIIIIIVIIITTILILIITIIIQARTQDRRGSLDPKQLAAPALCRPTDRGRVGSPSAAASTPTADVGYLHLNHQREMEKEFMKRDR